MLILAGKNIAKMLKVNIHTVLKQYNESNYSQQEDLILKEASAIINNADEKERFALDLIGLNKNIALARQINDRRQHEYRFSEVYDIQAIKKLAVNYGLRFLPANLYRGPIDPLLGNKLAKFIDEHEIKDFTSYGENAWDGKNSSFFILAPAASFELSERPKDPILFYKINSEKYAFVHQWGNDLSLFRYMPFFFIRNTITFMSLIFMFCALNFYIGFNYKTPIVLPFIIGSIIFSVIFLIRRYTEGETFLQEDKWDSRFKD